MMEPQNKVTLPSVTTPFERFKSVARGLVNVSKREADEKLAELKRKRRKRK